METLSFDLPGISPVGLDLIAMLNSPRVTVKQIAAQAKLDPVIFGNLIACANSPLYHEVNKTTDILTSLVRLGQREIKRIVYQVVLRSAFYHESPEVNAILRYIWHQSLTSSTFMQKFILEVPEAYNLVEEGLDYVECLGLLHNIGYVVLLVNFPDRFQDFFVENADKDLADFFQAEREWFKGHDHFTAGASVLEFWHFPPDLARIVAGYAQGGQEFEGSFAALYNLLRLSRHVIMMTDSNFHPRKPADFWLAGTDIPSAEVDYDQIISDVRETVQGIEASFS